jgi:hypothetical protein
MKTDQKPYSAQCCAIANHLHISCPEHGVKLLHIGRRCNMRQGVFPAHPVGVFAPFMVSSYSPRVCGVEQGAACAARAGHYHRDG